MDIQFGELLIHLDKTPAVLIAALPVMIVMQLPIIKSAISGLVKLNEFGVSKLPSGEDEL